MSNAPEQQANFFNEDDGLIEIVVSGETHKIDGDQFLSDVIALADELGALEWSGPIFKVKQTTQVIPFDEKILQSWTNANNGKLPDDVKVIVGDETQLDEQGNREKFIEYSAVDLQASGNLAKAVKTTLSNLGIQSTVKTALRIYNFIQHEVENAENFFQSMQNLQGSSDSIQEISPEHIDELCSSQQDDSTQKTNSKTSTSELEVNQKLRTG